MSKTIAVIVKALASDIKFLDKEKLPPTRGFVQVGLDRLISTFVLF